MKLLPLLIFLSLAISLNSQNCNDKYDDIKNLDVKGGHDTGLSFNIEGSSVYGKSEKLIKYLNVKYNKSNISFKRNKKAYQLGLLSKLEVSIYIKGILLEDMHLKLLFDSYGALRSYKLPEGLEKLSHNIVKENEYIFNQKSCKNCTIWKNKICRKEDVSKGKTFVKWNYFDIYTKELIGTRTERFLVSETNKKETNPIRSNNSSVANIYITNPGDEQCTTDGSLVQQFCCSLSNKLTGGSAININESIPLISTDSESCEFKYDCTDSDEHKSFVALQAYYYLSNFADAKSLGSIEYDPWEGGGSSYTIDGDPIRFRYTTDPNNRVGLAQDGDLITAAAFDYLYPNSGQRNEVFKGYQHYFVYDYRGLNSTVLYDQTPDSDWEYVDLTDPKDSDNEIWASLLYTISMPEQDGGIGLAKSEILFKNAVQLGEFDNYFLKNGAEDLFLYLRVMYEMGLLGGTQPEDVSLSNLCTVKEILEANIDGLELEDLALDFVIRDDILDLGNEPNNQSLDFWHSPSIINTLSPEENENVDPIYQTTNGVQDPNYLSALVELGTCNFDLVTTGSVSLGFTVAGPVHSWPEDFGETTTDEGLPLGMILPTIDIENYSFNGSLLKYTQQYNPFNPEDYSGHPSFAVEGDNFILKTCIRAIVDQVDDPAENNNSVEESNNIAQKNVNTIKYGLNPVAGGGGSTGILSGPYTVMMLTPLDSDGTNVSNTTGVGTVVKNTIELNFTDIAFPDANGEFPVNNTGVQGGINAIPQDNGDIVFEPIASTEASKVDVEQLLENNEIYLDIPSKIFNNWVADGAPGTDYEIVAPNVIAVKGANFEISVNMKSGIKHPMYIKFASKSKKQMKYTCQVIQYHAESPCHPGGVEYTLIPDTDLNRRSVETVDIETDFVLYPNPTSGAITITGNMQNVSRVKVITLEGRSTGAQMTIGKNEINIDSSVLPIGTYIAELILVDGTSQLIKFVKI